jgi:hypothetical protein
MLGSGEPQRVACVIALGALAAGSGLPRVVPAGIVARASAEE